MTGFSEELREALEGTGEEEGCREGCNEHRIVTNRSISARRLRSTTSSSDRSPMKSDCHEHLTLHRCQHCRLVPYMSGIAVLSLCPSVFRISQRPDKAQAIKKACKQRSHLLRVLLEGIFFCLRFYKSLHCGLAFVAFTAF
jgi:hypothetical protein